MWFSSLYPRSFLHRFVIGGATRAAPGSPPSWYIYIYALACICLFAKPRIHIGHMSFLSRIYIYPRSQTLHGIFAYIDHWSLKTLQLIGKYASPTECLGIPLRFIASNLCSEGAIFRYSRHAQLLRKPTTSRAVVVRRGPLGTKPTGGGPVAIGK